jgi:hypothetical protein
MLQVGARGIEEEKEEEENSVIRWQIYLYSSPGPRALGGKQNNFAHCLFCHHTTVCNC